MVPVVFLLHLTLLFFIVRLGISPNLLESSNSPDGLDSEKSQGSFPLAAILVGLSALGILLDSLQFRVLWLLLDATLLMLGIASFLPLVHRYVHPPFVWLSDLLKASAKFSWDSLLLSLRSGNVQESTVELNSSFYDVGMSYEQSSTTRSIPTECSLAGACAVCGASENLKADSKLVCLRWNKSVIQNAVVYTFLGLLFDFARWSLSRLGKDQPTLAFWCAATGFIASLVVSYNAAVQRFFSVKYSLCDLHSATQQKYPVLLTVDDSVYVEFGDAEVKSKLLYQQMVESKLIDPK
jgi:hypothetical protein